MNNESITSNYDFQNFLEKIKSENSIRGHVAGKALDHENIEVFFKDLLNNGCVSGMVPGLIYYHETHNFFNKHYDEIEDLRYEYEDNVGDGLPIVGDLKNFLSWFAFEEVAYQIASDWDLV